MSAPKDQVYSIEKELEQAALEIARFEEAIQSGEADASPEDRAQIALNKDRAKKLVKHRADVQQVVASAEGRRLLWRILEICGPNRISFDPTSDRITSLNEGKRMVGNEVLLMLFDADPNVYARMQREHLSDAKVEREREQKTLQKAKEAHDA